MTQVICSGALRQESEMSAEQEFERWWENHRQKMEPKCGDVKAAFFAAFALGSKSGLEEAAETIDAASHVRENLASCPPEIQAMVDHNGWLTVLRELLNKQAIRKRVDEGE